MDNYAGNHLIRRAFCFYLYESGIRGIPRTVSMLNWLLIMLLISGSRFLSVGASRCYFRISEEFNNKEHNKKNVVIYGAAVPVCNSLRH